MINVSIIYWSIIIFILGLPLTHVIQHMKGQRPRLISLTCAAVPKIDLCDFHVMVNTNCAYYFIKATWLVIKLERPLHTRKNQRNILHVSNVYLKDMWTFFFIHYMDKSIRTPDHYTNRECNDIVLKCIYFNMELVPLLQL